MAYAPHRPELHVTAEHGVLDAPAGLLVSNDQWHEFHQYEPPAGAPRWAHQSAENPFDWDICDDVLAPEGEETAVRAGSAVEHEGVQLIFTSVRGEHSSIHRATLTQLDSELSDDALALDPAVVRHGEIVGDRDGFTDFRSPCVVADGNGWLMLAVTGPVDDPQLVLLTSPDLDAWELQGPVTLPGDPSNLVAPRLVRLVDEVDGATYDVFLVTAERDGVDASGYLVGKLDGAKFTEVTPFTRIDYGHDFSRPRATNCANDETHIFGLMNGIGRLDDASTHRSLTEERWANCLTLPRHTTLQGGLLFQTPATGLVEAVQLADRAQLWSGLIDVQSGAVTVMLRDTEGPAARITHAGDALKLERLRRDEDPATAELVAADTDSLTIVVDGSTVEVYADGGVVTMASRVYFEGPVTITEEHSGDAQVLRNFTVGPTSAGSPAE